MQGYGSQNEAGRTCTKCGEFKAPEAFNRNGVKVDGSPRLRAICKACGSRRKTEATVSEKRCKDCGEVKPISEFLERGLRAYCRPCNNQRVYAHRRGSGREKHNARQSRYQKRKYHSDSEFRAKVRARSAVAEALQKGFPKPDACPECGDTEAVLHAHHHRGYAREYWLDVVWVCPRCHRAEEENKG